MSIDKETMRELIATQAQMAHLIMNYYLELKKSGMSDENALKLSQSYQTAIIKRGQSDEY